MKKERENKELLNKEVPDVISYIEDFLEIMEIISNKLNN